MRRKNTIVLTSITDTDTDPESSVFEREKNGPAVLPHLLLHRLRGDYIRISWLRPNPTDSCEAYDYLPPTLLR